MTCPRCAELEAEVGALRRLHGVKPAAWARLMSWFGIQEMQAKIALRLYEASGPVSVSTLVSTLQRDSGKRVLHVQVSILRKALAVGAIETGDDCYRLTDAGRADIASALAG